MKRPGANYSPDGDVYCNSCGEFVPASNFYPCTLRRCTYVCKRHMKQRNTLARKLRRRRLLLPGLEVGVERGLDPPTARD